MRSATILITAALAFVLLGSPATLQARPTPVSAAAILSQMVAAREGLNAFTVPIHFDIKLHKVISLPVTLEGVRYFERPDREALIMKTVPAVAKPFQKIFAGLGTAETWPSQYNISVVPLDAPANATMYELRGVPQAGGNVDYILLDVSQTTYEPLRARWFYKNGATIVMDVENGKVEDRYLLPKVEILDISFPSYKAHAVVTYGDYAVNTPIPDSVWQQNPSPGPSP